MPATRTAGSNVGANSGSACRRRRRSWESQRSRRNGKRDNGNTYGGGKTSHLQWRSRKSGRIRECMQTIHKNEDGRNVSSRTDILDLVTHIGRVSRYLERERDGGVRSRRN